MRHARLLFGAGARGDDPQVPVDLHGIRIDDHAAELSGERQRKRGLAAGSRPCDQDGVGSVHGLELDHGSPLNQTLDW
jgi:hypothetical protein